MNLELQNLSEKYAKQICSWKYDGECSIYNFPQWDIMCAQKWAITIEAKRKNEFIAVMSKIYGLCGYIRFVNKNNYVLIGLGLKPSLCGQGLGKVVMELLKNECKSRYNNKKIILEVRSFNKRAINCYKKAGFKIVDIYSKNTLIGYDEFIKMEVNT